jgi:hypothetical protein
VDLEVVCSTLASLLRSVPCGDPKAKRAHRGTSMPIIHPRFGKPTPLPTA